MKKIGLFFSVPFLLVLAFVGITFTSSCLNPNGGGDSNPTPPSTAYYKVITREATETEWYWLNLNGSIESFDVDLDLPNAGLPIIKDNGFIICLENPKAIYTPNNDDFVYSLGALEDPENTHFQTLYIATLFLQDTWDELTKKLGSKEKYYYRYYIQLEDNTFIYGDAVEAVIPTAPF